MIKGIESKREYDDDCPYISNYKEGVEGEWDEVALDQRKWGDYYWKGEYTWIYVFRLNLKFTASQL